MSTYPDYVYQTLARARDEGQWYCGQADAAALCFIPPPTTPPKRNPNEPPFVPPTEFFGDVDEDENKI